MSANLGTASRFYRGTTITPSAGGGQIRLKHRELFLTDKMKNATEKTVTDARFKVLTARARMAMSPLPADVAAALTLYFKTGASASAGDTNAIIAVLELISNGINADVNIKVSQINKTYLDPGERQSDTEGYVRGTVGDIHVTPDYIKNNPFQAVRTFIHEASHRYADTDDFDEQGYIKADGSDFREAGISNADCLKNADSYAYFVMKVAP